MRNFITEYKNNKRKKNILNECRNWKKLKLNTRNFITEYKNNKHTKNTLNEEM